MVSTVMSQSKAGKDVPGAEKAINATINGDIKINGLPKLHIPFKTKLSFGPLLRDWQKKVNSTDVAERLLAVEIMERVKKSPELWQPFDDYSQLDTYRETVDLLLAGLYPLSLRNTQLAKASKPFEMQSFFMTPAVRNMMQGCSVNVSIEKQDDLVFRSVALKACATILNECYGQNLNIDPLIIFSMEPEACGVSYHYKSLLNVEFLEVVAVKPLGLEADRQEALRDQALAAGIFRCQRATRYQFAGEVEGGGHQAPIRAARSAGLNPTATTAPSSKTGRLISVG